MDKEEKSFWLVIFVLIFEVAFVLLFISSDWIRWGVKKENQWIEAMYGEVPAKEIKEKTKDLYKTLVVEPKLKSKIYDYFNVDEAYRIPQACFATIRNTEQPSIRNTQLRQ